MDRGRLRTVSHDGRRSKSGSFRNCNDVGTIAWIQLVFLQNKNKPPKKNLSLNCSSQNRRHFAADSARRLFRLVQSVVLSRNSHAQRLRCVGEKVWCLVRLRHGAALQNVSTRRAAHSHAGRCANADALERLSHRSAGGRTCSFGRKRHQRALRFECAGLVSIPGAWPALSRWN